MSRSPGAPRVGARRWWSVAVCAVACATAAHATPVAGKAGDPVNVASPRDPEFGVTTRRHGLRRSVAMLQWRRAGDGFERSWETVPVDDGDFPAGRSNPEFPLPSREWLAEVRVDGCPLARDALVALGEWRRLRPDFASLPGNMSATFQPEGDGLGTAANPQSPDIGDLRITWQALHLPPLAGRIVLEDGTWRIAPGQQPADGDAEAPAPDAASTLAPGPAAWRDWRVLLVALGVLLAIGIAVARRR